MELDIAELISDPTAFESAQMTGALGAGGLSALLLALGFWIKRYMPLKHRVWIPGILMVVGLAVYIAYSGFSLSSVIMGFLASNAAVGIYEGGRGAKAAAALRK